MCKVANTAIVDPQDLWITYDRDKPMLTMFACHPKGSARYRVVVTADLVGGDGSALQHLSSLGNLAAWIAM